MSGIHRGAVAIVGAAETDELGSLPGMSCSTCTPTRRSTRCATRA